MKNILGLLVLGLLVQSTAQAKLYADESMNQACDIAVAWANGQDSFGNDVRFDVRCYVHVILTPTRQVRINRVLHSEGQVKVIVQTVGASSTGPTIHETRYGTYRRNLTMGDGANLTLYFNGRPHPTTFLNSDYNGNSRILTRVFGTEMNFIEGDGAIPE